LFETPRQQGREFARKLPDLQVVTPNGAHRQREIDESGSPADRVSVLPIVRTKPLLALQPVFEPERTSDERTDS
jgi:hypothetical protein